MHLGARPDRTGVRYLSHKYPDYRFATTRAVKDTFIKVPPDLTANSPEHMHFEAGHALCSVLYACARHGSSESVASINPGISGFYFSRRLFSKPVTRVHCAASGTLAEQPSLSKAVEPIPVSVALFPPMIA